MAAYGSFNTTKYSDRYLIFSWNIKTSSTNNNYSVIKWSLTGAGGTTTRWYNSGPFTVVIDGEEVYKSNTRIELYNGTEVASGEKTIKHNADGKYTFTASVSAAIYSASVNVSGSGSWELNQIPRAATLTTAQNFNDEGNPVITYSNLAGDSIDSLQACIASTDGKTIFVPYRDVSKTATGYTFSLTTAERNTLRNACNNAKSMTVRFFLQSVIGGNTYWSTSDKTLSIVNANPTINATIIDTNSTITALTGDNNIMVKGYSNASITTGAVALKGATIKSTKIVNGNKSLTANGTINAVDSGTFTIAITDSRGNTTTKTINKTLVNYIKPTVNLTGGNISTAGALTLTISGLVYNGSIGNTSNLNYAVSYCYSADGGSYTSWENVTYSYKNNSYTATVNLTGLNYQSTYKFKARIIDKLNTITTTEVEIMSKPVFEWGKNVFCINANKTEGNLYGLNQLVSIPEGANINNYTTAGVYGVTSNANAKNITNIPIKTAGRLIVYSAAGTPTTNSYSYLIQEYHPIVASDPVYKRLGTTSGTANQWSFGAWYRQSGGVILWSGLAVMDNGHTATLKESVTKQPNGIMLRFVAYDTANGVSRDYHYQEFFVSKDFVTNHEGKGHTFAIWGNGFNAAATKYLYIYDDKITGNGTNVTSGTSASGIIFNNNNYVLCEVIGV